MAISNSLVGWWGLDDGSGTTATDRVSVFGKTAHNGTLKASATWGSGKVGGALTVASATSDYVELTASIVGSGAKTLCAWIKPTSGTGGYIFNNFAGSGSTGVYLYGNTSTGTIISWNGGSTNLTAASATPTVGSWSFHCGVFPSSGSTGIIYFNGKVSNSGSLGTEATNTNKFRINGRWVTPDTGSAVMIDGNIDEVRLYNRALSAAEIWEIYQGG